jgi:hypothetical protein
MPVEIKELLIRTIWGGDTAEDDKPSAEKDADNKEDAKAGASDEMQNIQTSIRKVIEQTQER